MSICPNFFSLQCTKYSVWNDVEYVWVLQNNIIPLYLHRGIGVGYFMIECQARGSAMRMVRQSFAFHVKISGDTLSHDVTVMITLIYRQRETDREKRNQTDRETKKNCLWISDAFLSNPALFLHCIIFPCGLVQCEMESGRILFKLNSSSVALYYKLKNA
jgi:hypothetical protein